MKVLEYLDRGGELEECRRKFELTRGDVLTIIRNRSLRLKSGGRMAEMAEISSEHVVRTRLWDKAMNAVEDSLDPLERAIEKSPALSQPHSPVLMGIAINHLKNRGIIGTKVLEGIGDFRRGGDDVPREIPRRPLFNLPPGAHVAVRMEITTGEQNGSSNTRTIEAERISETSEDGSEAVGIEIQEGQSLR